MIKNLTIAIVLNLLWVCAVAAQTNDTMNAPQTAATTFTYQGKLTDGSVSAAANYDFEFRLYDALSGGTQQGTTVQKLAVPVANGIFTASLDFGDQFPGADRFLDISVRTAGGGVFTLLTPRQPITSAPHAVRSLTAASVDTARNATTATNSTQLGGVTADQFVVPTDPRMTDTRPTTAGSGSYIQNQNAAPQASSNFNISGSGRI